MITLKFIIKKNKEKSIKECLWFLIKNFCHLQNTLDAEFCINMFIYNKLINTCQDILTYQHICFKPIDSLACFINNPHFSIIIFQKTNSDNIEIQVFFTNQRYYK